ncbi:MAG: hypothetical protein IJ501_01010 [Bacilli bacterium]|nr:hypothetical protein [Bacilli bacterium]
MSIIISKLFNIVTGLLFYVIITDVIWSVYNYSISKKLKIENEYKEQKKLIKKSKNSKIIKICLPIFLISVILFFVVCGIYFVYLFFWMLTLGTLGYSIRDSFDIILKLLFSIAVISYFVRKFYVNSELNKFLNKK